MTMQLSLSPGSFNEFGFGKLIFDPVESMFDTSGIIDSSAASVLVNDINIGFDSSGRLSSIWGYCPKESWRHSLVLPPSSVKGVLYTSLKMVPGTSKRITPLGKFWPVVYDSESKWIAIVPEDGRDFDAFFEVMSGAVVGICSGDIAGLWLKANLARE